MKSALRLLLPALLLLAAAFALGQPNTPPQATLQLGSAKAKPGEVISGVVRVVFAPGLHGYQNPPSESYMIPVAVQDDGADVKLAGAKYPAGVDATIGGSETPVKAYEGTIEIPVTVTAPSKAGSYTVSLKVKYQQCNENTCFPPGTVPVTGTLVVNAPDTPVVPVVKPPVGSGAEKPPVKKPEPTAKDPKTAPEKPVVEKPAPDNPKPPVVNPSGKTPEKPVVEKDPPTVAPVSGTSAGSEITGGGPPTVSTTEPTSSSQDADDSSGGFIESNLKRAFQTGNYLFVVLLALLTGLALAVTPCVYPMIPITVGFFSNQTTGNRAGRIGLGLMYMAGLAITYGAVGGLSAALGGTIGSLFQAPWFLFALGVLMAVLALSMFDVYEIRLPAFLGKQIHGRSGAVGALIMGLLMGFAAAPCAGPVVTIYAVKVAEYNNLPLGLLLFTSIGVGLGLPFFALGALSTGAKTLPRAGGWLKTLKALLGLVVFGVALNYLLQAFQFRSDEPRTMAVQAAFLLASAAYLVFFEKSGSTQVIWGMKGVAILLCGLFAGQLLANRSTAIRDAQLAALGASNSVRWEKFTEESFATARQSGKPIVIDATADWCAICHEIDKAVFKQPEGILAMRDVVALRIDHSTGVDPKYVEMTSKALGIKGLPHVEILKPGGERVKVVTGFDQLDTPEKLKGYLALASE